MAEKAERRRTGGRRVFVHDMTSGNITMHRGDTGAYKVHATRKSGEPFTDADRMLYTVKDAAGNIMMQRFYKLTTDLGNGVTVIQFHNDDTDKWPTGVYNAERRYWINPRWSNGPVEGDCVNALTAGTALIEGDVVRVPVAGQRTIMINTVYGEG